MKTRSLFCIAFALSAVTACSQDLEPLDIAAEGGTTITAEVDVADFLLTEASFSNDTQFLQALEESRKGNVEGKERIAAFVKRFNELSPGLQAGAFFNGQKPRIYKQVLGAEQLIKQIGERHDSAIRASELIIGKRLSSFGIEQDKWKVSDDGKGHVVVDVAASVDPKRVCHMLIISARLGFYETIDAVEAYRSLEALENNYLRKVETAEIHPVLRKISNPNQVGSGLVGYVEIRDTAALGNMLRIARTPGLIRSDLHFMWGSTPEDTGNGYRMALYAIEADNLMIPVIGGEAIAHASAAKDQMSNQVTVNVTMTAEGANRWADMTEDNIGRAIAIVLEGQVLSCPNVLSAITGGDTQISGNFTVAQANELAALLGSAPLPARLIILDMKSVKGK